MFNPQVNLSSSDENLIINFKDISPTHSKPEYFNPFEEGSVDLNRVFL